MQPTPDLTLYRLIHRGMRTDARRVQATLEALSRPDRHQATALARWYDGFLTEFHGHHAVEDQIFFPALARRVAGFETFAERIEHEHGRLDHALSTAGTALHTLATTSTGWDGVRAEAVAAIAGAQQVLGDHLDFEDDEILPLFLRHMPKDEFDALGDEALKHNGFKGLLFGVPWAMSHTTAEEKAVLLEEAPMPLRLLWRATRRRYARAANAAFATTATVKEVA